MRRSRRAPWGRTSSAARLSPTTLLARHTSGDWGDIPPEDARENRVSIERGFRVMSSYRAKGKRPDDERMASDRGVLAVQVLG